jgi:hypothetical protein
VTFVSGYGCLFLLVFDGIDIAIGNTFKRALLFAGRSAFPVRAIAEYLKGVRACDGLYLKGQYERVEGTGSFMDGAIYVFLGHTVVMFHEEFTNVP